MTQKGFIKSLIVGLVLIGLGYLLATAVDSPGWIGVPIGLFLLAIPGTILIGITFIIWQFSSGERRTKTRVLGAVFLVIVGIFVWSADNERGRIRLVKYPKVFVRAVEFTEELGIANKVGEIWWLKVKPLQDKPDSNDAEGSKDPAQVKVVSVYITIGKPYDVPPELLELKDYPHTVP